MTRNISQKTNKHTNCLILCVWYFTNRVYSPPPPLRDHLSFKTNLRGQMVSSERFQNNLGFGWKGLMKLSNTHHNLCGIFNGTDPASAVFLVIGEKIFSIPGNSDNWNKENVSINTSLSLDSYHWSLVAWQHQVITWTNVDLSSTWTCSINSLAPGRFQFNFR